MKEISEKQLQDVARRFNVQELYVFGSRANEIAERLLNGMACSVYPESDVDIAVRAKAGVTLGPAERVQLALGIEDILEVSRVDLVILQEADPFLALEIMRGELLYAEDLNEQARYELYVLGRAGDLHFFKEERIRMIMEEGAR